MIHLEYKEMQGTLQVPRIDVSPFRTFVFFCYTSPPTSVVHAFNQGQFFKNLLPDLGSREDVLLVMLNNCRTWNAKSRNVNWMHTRALEIRRPNLGYDFGAYADAVATLDLASRAEDFHLLCMNDTVCGPFIPWWIEPKPDWLEILKRLITQEVKLGGMTINTYKMNPPHVQSMLLITDRIGFQIGWENDIFVSRQDKEIVVQLSECAFSAAVLKAGYNIDCLATLLHGIDWRKKDKKDIQDRGDICFPNKYIPECTSLGTIHPMDSMFAKTTRYGIEGCRVLQRASEDKDTQK